MPRVDANGVQIYVEESGSGSPLLLIMGLGASHEAWSAQREAFARQHRVIEFDNRGAGRSASPPTPWTIPDMVHDAVGVLDALAVPRAHVLGVSMGGMVAQEMAILFPDRVDRLIVANSFARPDPLRRAFLLHRCWARLQGADPLRESIASLPWLLTTSLLQDRARMESVLEVLAGMSFVTAEAYAAQIDAILEHVTLDRLGGVRAPTLVLAAAEDVLTPLFLSEEIAAAIPGARLETLPLGNHGALLEYPDDFNRAVLAWLKENPDSPCGDMPPRR